MSESAAKARDYYVSPRGSDANPGTAAQPWQNIVRVNRAAFRPGDRVLFEGGQMFAGTLTLNEQQGTETAHIAIGSFGEDKATINGGVGNGLVATKCQYLRIHNLNFIGCGRKTGNDGSGVILRGGVNLGVDQVEVSGFRLDGLLVTGVYDTSITHVYAHDNGSAGISVGGGDTDYSRNVYIGYCVAENNPGDPKNLENHSGNGIVVGYVQGCVIEYCEACNNGWDMPRQGNGPVGIWAWHADCVIIQHCISHDNKSPGDDGGGFDLDGGLTNCLVQYNYSYNNDGPGYFLCQYYPAPEWKNNIVRYNISINDGAKTNRRCAFDVFGGWEGMSDAEVYHNTICSEVSGAVGFGGMPAPRIRFQNNIFVGTGELVRGDASPARFEGNCFWQLGAPANFAEGAASFHEWVAVTGQEHTDNVTLGQYANPMLVNSCIVALRDPKQLAALLGYKIQAASPCCRAGVPIENDGGRDFWGVNTTGHTPTIGACQKP